MAKKHRVKRANYVKHLLEVERKREAYLDKRKNRKRGREQRNEEDIFDEARDVAMQSQLKKRRQDPAIKEEAPAAPEETKPQAAPRANPFADMQAASGAAVSGGFFDVQQTAPASSTPAAASTVSKTAKKKVMPKKKY